MADPSDSPPAGIYHCDINHTSVLWRIKHLGLAWYTGRFTQFNGTLRFDPAAVERSELSFNVELSSVRAEYQGTDKDWDAELAQKSDFFDASRHPKAAFVSRSVKRTGEMTLRITGDLAFRGATKPLIVDAVYNGALLKDQHGRTLVGFSAQTIVKRSEYGLTFFLGPLMPDDVQLIIESEFVLQPVA